jgi:hypothetical protein
VFSGLNEDTNPESLNSRILTSYNTSHTLVVVWPRTIHIFQLAIEKRRGTDYFWLLMTRNSEQGETAAWMEGKKGE